MRWRSSTYQKLALFGLLLVVCAFIGNSFLSETQSFLGIVVLVCVFAGYLLFRGSLTEDQLRYSRTIEAMRPNPEGAYWLRIAAVVLFLGVLPIVCLWVYHSIQHLRP